MRGLFRLFTLLEVKGVDGANDGVDGTNEGLGKEADGGKIDDGCGEEILEGVDVTVGDSIDQVVSIVSEGEKRGAFSTSSSSTLMCTNEENQSPRISFSDFLPLFFFNLFT